MPKKNKNLSGGHKRIIVQVHKDFEVERKMSWIDKYNPPITDVRFIRGEMWEKMVDHPNWIHAGYVPAPKTMFYAFVYHFCMGALMHYPLLSILRFCLRRNSLEPWPDDPIPTEPRNRPAKVTKKPRHNKRPHSPSS